MAITSPMWVFVYHSLNSSSRSGEAGRVITAMTYFGMQRSSRADGPRNPMVSVLAWHSGTAASRHHGRVGGKDETE
jgi:hypothetical protein